MESEKRLRREKRDTQVRAFFAELEKKYPQWRLDALLEETADRFPPIAPATVSSILRRSGTYKVIKKALQ